tara:strand:- start:703 stop:2529 length:1827 start_codon:yes stop_codon:yes gene_type:complete
MDIKIHIGPPKTGTSAIQKWCLQNKEKLLQSGVYYPVHDLDPNGVSSGNLLSLYERNQSDELKYSCEKLKLLLADAKEKGARTILLSSEFFFKKVPEIAIKIPNAIFVAYIRFDLGKVESNYNQSVKRHGEGELFKPPANPHSQGLKFLERYIRAYGEERFLMRAYGNSCFRKGNIIDDFLFCLNVNSEEFGDIAGSSVVNSGYSLEGLEFKRWFNKFEEAELQHVLDRFLQQQSSTGTVNFSFLSTDDFDALKKIFLKELERFCYRFKVHNSSQLINESKEMRQRKPRIQHLGLSEFVNLSHDLIDYDANSLKGLHKFVERLENLKIDATDKMRLDALKKVIQTKKKRSNIQFKVTRSVKKLHSVLLDNTTRKIPITERLSRAYSSTFNKQISEHKSVLLLSHNIPFTCNDAVLKSISSIYGESALYEAYSYSGAPNLSKGENIWIPSQIKVVQGHFRANEEHRKIFPNAIRSCWVRDPLERIWMYFQHVLNSQQPADHHLKLMSLADINNIVRENDLFVAMMESKDFDFLKRIYTSYIGKVGSEEFDFIGSVYRYKDGLRVLSDKLCLPTDSFSPEVSRAASTVPVELKYLRRLLAKEYALVDEFL